jgi:fatty-acyl-CoA synthase
MLGGMQDFELRVMRLLDHAAREHGPREIVTRWADGSETRSDWAGIARDARKLAQALERLGLEGADGDEDEGGIGDADEVELETDAEDA